MTRYKVLPEVPTEEMIDATGSRYDDLKEMVVANYKAMYEAAPSVECEPIGWTDKLQLSYLDNGEAMLVYPDTCEAEIPIYTTPQDQSAKIAELEVDKQKLIEALEKFQPLTDNLGWIALIWNDHNFTNTTMLNKLKDAFGALGFNRGQDVKHINKFRDDLEALLSKMKGE